MCWFALHKYKYECICLQFAGPVLDSLYRPAERTNKMKCIVRHTTQYINAATNDIELVMTSPQCDAAFKHLTCTLHACAVYIYTSLMFIACAANEKRYDVIHKQRN